MSPLAQIEAGKPQQKLAYTFDQAAELIGIPRNTLRDAHSRGEFRAKKVGKRWLVLHSELERWLQS